MIYIETIKMMNQKRESWNSKECKGIKIIKDNLDATIYRTIRELDALNVTSLERFWKSINQLIKNPKEQDIDEVLKLYQNNKLDTTNNQTINQYC